MLDLARVHARLVHDRLTIAQQERAARINLVLVARVADVREGLHEQAADAKALLKILIRPVPDLRRAVGTGQLNRTRHLRHADRGDEFRVIGRTNVHARLTVQALEEKVARIRGTHRRCTRRRRTRNGIGLARILVPEIIAAHILATQLVAETFADRTGVTDRAAEDVLLTALKGQCRTL